VTETLVLLAAQGVTLVTLVAIHWRFSRALRNVEARLNSISAMLDARLAALEASRNGGDPLAVAPSSVERRTTN
jgi:hypothetical protein